MRVIPYAQRQYVFDPVGAKTLAKTRKPISNLAAIPQNHDLFSAHIDHVDDDGDLRLRPLFQNNTS